MSNALQVAIAVGMVIVADLVIVVVVAVAGMGVIEEDMGDLQAVATTVDPQAVTAIVAGVVSEEGTGASYVFLGIFRSVVLMSPFCLVCRGTGIGYQGSGAGGYPPPVEGGLGYGNGLPPAMKRDRDDGGGYSGGYGGSSPKRMRY